MIINEIVVPTWAHGRSLAPYFEFCLVAAFVCRNAAKSWHCVSWRDQMADINSVEQNFKIVIMTLWGRNVWGSWSVILCWCPNLDGINLKVRSELWKTIFQVSIWIIYFHWIRIVNPPFVLDQSTEYLWSHKAWSHVYIKYSIEGSPCEVSKACTKTFFSLLTMTTKQDFPKNALRYMKTHCNVLIKCVSVFGL